PGKFIAAQPTVGSDNFFPEQPLHLGERGLPRVNDLSGDDVGINHGKTAFAQQIGGRRFAHADASGKSKGFHGAEGADFSANSQYPLRKAGASLAQPIPSDTES